MCGIAGFAGVGNRDDIKRMTRRLAHRGPDGEGFFVDESLAVYLGHRRLAIVDIASGDQPMWSADGRFCVIFNGEIYNHLELREELQRLGRRFLSHHSDTEVLIHGYAQWGRDLPLRLNGMFAFVIYDRQRGTFFGARDRFGEKPLYISHAPRLFAFASELTSLASHPDVSHSIDIRALQKLFAYGYIPSPHALLSGTEKLPAGHWFEFDISRRTLAKQPYWRFQIETDDALTDADEPRLVEECSALLSQAAKRRLMSDVPLGLFLSGGLDSSAVLSALSNLPSAGRTKTFTIGFTEPSFDESAYARAVARHLNSEHHERVLSIEMARALIPTVLNHLDEPLGDASILPTYMLSAFAREHVKVALTGDGGDELFAGYDPFVALPFAQLYSRVTPGVAHKAFRKLADFLPTSHANMSVDFKIKRTLQGLSQAQNAWLPTWMAPIDPADLAEMFECRVSVEDLYDEAISLWNNGGCKPLVDKALEFYTRFYLQDDILMKSDRASMASSLETRAVFLDNDLVDFCRRLPHRFKIRRGERKYLLKKAVSRLLPKEIVQRKKKGFGIPLAKWLREDLPGLTFEPIPGVRGEFVRNAYAEHRRGHADQRLLLWSWMSTQAFVGQIGATAAP